MEFNLKEEILKEPLIISVNELMKYVVINKVFNSISENMETSFVLDDVTNNVKNNILGVIKKFTQPDPSVKTNVDERPIVTIKYIDGGTTEYADDKIEFSMSTA